MCEFSSAAEIVFGAVHTVENETNYHTFSSRHPVLARIRPGDVVVTKTVDSAGFDYKGSVIPRPTETL